VIDAMPTTGPLIDRFGRIHRGLRISVTHRCDLRCVHCLPDEDVRFLPRGERLDYREWTRVAEIAHRLGVVSVRVTGGEPLIRRGIAKLVASLSAIGFEDVSLTTNGTELARLAPELAAAGLHRVNVSCDSLQADQFARIRRRGELSPVLASMDAAESAGLSPVKVNVVPIVGVNDDEVESFAEFARSTGRAHGGHHCGDRDLSACSRCVPCRHAPGNGCSVDRREATARDILEAARVAGIQAAKLTSQLSPLCHPLLLQDIHIIFTVAEDHVAVGVEVGSVDRTGVEMEALTAGAVAALTIYDMCKSSDPDLSIEDLCVWGKTGGRSGSWHREESGDAVYSDK
jgi:molybdenum cofactor biosynthesis protein MoaC